MVWSLSSATALIKLRNSRTSHSPKRTPSGFEAAGQSQAFPDEMGQAALAAGIIAIGAVAVGDQPTQDGVAEQVADFLVAAAADMEDGGGGAQHYPQPAAPRGLGPPRLIGLEGAGPPGPRPP